MNLLQQKSPKLFSPDSIIIPELSLLIINLKYMLSQVIK